MKEQEKVFRQEMMSEKRKRGFSANDKSVVADFIKQRDGCAAINKTEPVAGSY